ncbi:MAG: chromosomal replication initiator protein DnaA [Bacteroidales bacterium]|nr:chromosomal replication initiator protein DnaA [Bacteroidales bacterium]
MQQGTHLKIWENCLQIIKDNVDPDSFFAWFKPIKAVAYKDSILTLQVPSHFFYEYLEEHYIDLLRRTLRRVIGLQARLEYRVVVDNTTAPKNIRKSTVKIPSSHGANVENKPVSVQMSNTPKNPFIIPGIKKVTINSQLDKNLTFENFVEGACNKLGRNAGFKIAENPGKTAFNPLLLHGTSGVGKTHLSHSIGLKTKELNPDKIVLYVSAHDFQTRYTDAVRNNSVNDFINFFHSIDVFIVDDIQDFMGKEATQKIFFNIFNFLHQQGKQLILTSDRPPSELEGFFDRLLTRFKWGLTAELQTPDYETRVEILKRKAYESGIEVSDKVLELIAYSITTSIRELEGALLSVLAYSAVDVSKITLELTKKVLKNLIKERKPDYTIEQIIQIVSDYFKIAPKAVKAKTRKREVVQARHLAMHFAKLLTNKSLSSIGTEFGGRDHSTVLHAMKTVNNLSDTDKEFRSYIEDIERLLKY